MLKIAKCEWALKVSPAGTKFIFSLMVVLMALQPAHIFLPGTALMYNLQMSPTRGGWNQVGSEC